MNIHTAMNMPGLSSATVGVFGDGGGFLCTPAFGPVIALRSTSRGCGLRFGNFGGPGLRSQYCGGEEQFGRIWKATSPTNFRRQLRVSLGRRVCEVQSSVPSRGHLQQENYLKFSDFASSRLRPTASPVCCSVGVTPLEESKPEADEAGQRDQKHEVSVVSSSGENLTDRPQLLSGIPEHVVSNVGGKTGSIAFYSRRNGSLPEKKFEGGKLLSLIWLLGPFILVASVVLPPLYLRKIFGAVLEDSLVTDFVILFFTEAFFFLGASAFLYIAHISRESTSDVSPKESTSQAFSLGYRTSARVALAVAVLLPTATFVLAWPWTGPAAAAALAPYMVGVLVQLGFEKVILANNSRVWPLVPITFQMYRLHQLNRAAQLVAGLLFSVKGVEATAETMAINVSLQTLLFVLQALAMLSLWSLGSFLTNHLPTKAGQQCTPSLP